MARQGINDLLAFLAVAKEKRFTRAAAKLGVSQSALSHTSRALEERLGLRLLMRTTRSVAPTAAGERLLVTVGPRFDEIDAELAALGELREKPAGTIRITAGEHAADSILWPALTRILPHYPEIKVEIIVDYGLTDIVAERYDAGSGPLHLAADYQKIGRVAREAVNRRYDNHATGDKDSQQLAKPWSVGGGVRDLLADASRAAPRLGLGSLAGEILGAGRDAGVAVDHPPILQQDFASEKPKRIRTLGLMRMP